MISHMIFIFLSVCEYFLVATGVEARAAEPQLTAASDNESDWVMDSDEARDYADQFPDLDGPDSPGRINNRNLEVLEAVLKVNQNVSTKKIFIVYQTSGSCLCAHKDSARSNCSEL
jgi:hypothetical protein